jgi:putative effector of murein hydrolase/putative effector of murein hydrolase LrgA (UPF0299 family)
LTKKLAADIARAADEAATAAQASSASAAASRAVSAGADALAGEVEALASSLASSVQAAGSDRAAAAKAALKSVDALVEQFSARLAKLRAAAGGRSGEEAASASAAASAFVREANTLRARLESGALSAEDVAREVASLAASAGAALRTASLELAAAAAGGAASASPSASSASPLSFLTHYAKLWLSLGSLFFLDKAIKSLFVAQGIAFPSALAGMFGVFAVLCLVGEKAANQVLAAYAPALAWIARWLPLFYVPALVTLPLALNGIPGADLLRIVGILAVGMVATLLFTAQTTVWIREAVKTPVKEVAKGKPSAPFTAAHYACWALVAATSLLATLVDPAGLGPRAALPFGLAATVGGYLLGDRVPKNMQGVLHPVVVTALVANGGVALQGALQGWTYAAAQKAYLNKGALSIMGAGDALMSLLGVVIVSFGFRIYTQRDTAMRHAPEIFGATALSSLFSLFSTAFAAKALGLSAVLAKALIPRSVTVALALPIAQSLEAPLAITAAAVLLQGILGANFGPGLMTAVGIKDTIARGLAAAGTAGGLGTASLTSKEPEALPFCALSYAMVGIFSTCVTAIPAVRDALVAIVA